MTILPAAPSEYIPRDQDHIRRILMEGFDGMARRLFELESAPEVPPDPQPGPTALRFGLFSMQGRIGEGPGGSTAGPIYPIAYTNASPSAINAEIAQAIADDIVLIHIPAGSPGRFTHHAAGICQGPPGSFEGEFIWSCYEASVRRFEGNSTYAAAVASKRVLQYVADEPNIAGYQDSFSPTLLNDAGQLHKEIWPGSLTFVRVTPAILQAGWDGNAPPVGGYTGIDYAWAQYSGALHRSNVTPGQNHVTQKAIAANINVGLAASLNIWGAGIQHDFDGVTGCWDYENNGISHGVVQGTPAANGYSEGQQIPCGSFVLPNSSSVMANPDWMKHYADLVSQDPDLPFALFWNYPSDGAGSGYGIPYIDRPDIVEALQYTLAKCATRTSWVGYRTPKPWDGVPR